MTELLPPKKEVALALLERSNVDVYLDPRARGVVVPPQFRKEPRLILKVGLNMPVPIPDLRVDEDSMSCTLSFNRSPFYCVVPWSSVFAMVGEDGRGMVWPDDVPQELAVKTTDPASAPSRPRAVPSDASSGSQGESAPASRRNGRGSKLAEEPTAAKGSAAGATNGKRRKKKDAGEERPRPVLVAVPSERPSEARRDSARESSRDAKPESSRSPDSRLAPDSRSARPDARRDGRVDPPPPPDSRPSLSLSLDENAMGQRAESGAPPQTPRDGVSAVPTARPTGSPRRPPSGPARPKRELPPYLRVVK